jgi:hypothetical protein
MSLETEIELTFLARFLPPEVENIKPIIMEDIYIPENSKFPMLRLRKKDDSYEVTKKSPIKEGDFSEHTEHTIELDNQEYTALKQSSSRTVSKKRYAVQINGYEA